MADGGTTQTDETVREPADVVRHHGCDLAVWTLGAPAGQPVVLLHGAGADHRLFAPQAEALADAGYRVITWDLPGHGRSRPLHRAFTVPDAAAATVAVMDAVGVARAVLVGQSLGGYVAQQAVLSTPGRIRAVVTIGSTCITRPVRWSGRAALAVSRPMLRAWPYHQLLTSMTAASAVTPEARAYLSEVFAGMDRRDLLNIWDGTSRCIAPDLTYHVPCPLMLIRGESDRTGDVAEDQELWAARDSAESHVVEGAGHVANLDRPEAVNRLLLDFLSRLSDRIGRPAADPV